MRRVTDRLYEKGEAVSKDRPVAVQHRRRLSGDVKPRDIQPPLPPREFSVRLLPSLSRLRGSVDDSAPRAHLEEGKRRETKLRNARNAGPSYNSITAPPSPSVTTPSTSCSPRRWVSSSGMLRPMAPDGAPTPATSPPRPTPSATPSAGRMIPSHAFSPRPILWAG